MRKILLASAALVALTAFSAPAFAADDASTKVEAAATTAKTTTAEKSKNETTKLSLESIADSIGVKGCIPVKSGHTALTNNAAYVDQVGINNINEQDQTGKNLSIVSQTGRVDGKNVAYVTQNSSSAGRNSSYVEQGGDFNELRVVQTGDDNTAVMSQSGTKNGWAELAGGKAEGHKGVSSEQWQKGTGNEAYGSVTGAMNFSAQQQFGDRNFSLMVQNGIGSEAAYANVARVYQGTENVVSSDNDAYTSQHGVGNFAVTKQTGATGGHLSIQIQSGSGNGINGTSLSNDVNENGTGAYISQAGSSNTALQAQIGNLNLASISQRSSNNIAAQYQIGNGNKAFATQDGTGNILTQVQYLSGNVARAHQYTSDNIGLQVQTGSSNTALLEQRGGNGNWSSQYQGSSSNFSSTTQDGTGNRSTVTQN